ncbi:hypothetical protein [Chryseobacterium indoltheticum]|uniref:hypothetical protein n=1 Tax=Chryseobacterium indoltheticum TaxID=254 RepID=UPI003F49702C
MVKDFLNHDIEGFEAHTFSLQNFAQQIHLKQNSFTLEKRNSIGNDKISTFRF